MGMSAEFLMDMLFWGEKFLDVRMISGDLVSEGLGIRYCVIRVKNISIFVVGARSIGHNLET